MRIELFDYTLPPELIAQTPSGRGESRLLVLNRADGSISHRRFPELLDYLHSGDTLVLNDTRVIARRLTGFLPNGSRAEIFLLRPNGSRAWIALVRPGRALRPGKTVEMFGPTPEDGSLVATITEVLPDGSRILEFETEDGRDRITHWGDAPLPPYIRTQLPREQEDRYQTVYAAHDGSAAAPTAGLHFTPEMLQQIQRAGIAIAYVTLHVGIDTFRPIKVDDTDSHEMHGEWLSVSQAAADIINGTKGRIVAVGTTSVRALESAAQRYQQESNRSETDRSEELEESGMSRMPECRVAPCEGDTHLFITPGYRFRAVDALVTNFHLPRSTLLMLISALATREQILNAYAEAIQQGYRFYSFGDAMLII